MRIRDWSSGVCSSDLAAAGAGPHRTGGARAAEAQRRMAGEGYFASRCKGAEPRRKIAARQAIARPARAAAVALQRRPEARALPGWGEDQPVRPEDGGPGKGREPVYLLG